MEKTYDTAEAVKAQERYCDEHEIPIFAPRNGLCSWCGRNIYAPSMYSPREGQTRGISVEEAGSRLITSCPRCNATFVD